MRTCSSYFNMYRTFFMTIFIFSGVFFRFFTTINTFTAQMEYRHLHDGTPHSAFHHQRTLTNMPLQHFPITYKAEINTHMSSSTLRNIPALFSSPHTIYMSRYTTICVFSNRGKLGLQHVFSDVFLNYVESKVNGIIDGFETYGRS